MSDYRLLGASSFVVAMLSFKLVFLLYRKLEHRSKFILNAVQSQQNEWLL
jgi:hypothetical protein